MAISLNTSPFAVALAYISPFQKKIHNLQLRIFIYSGICHLQKLYLYLINSSMPSRMLTLLYLYSDESCTTFLCTRIYSVCGINTFLLVRLGEFPTRTMTAILRVDLPSCFDLLGRKRSSQIWKSPDNESHHRVFRVNQGQDQLMSEPFNGQTPDGARRRPSSQHAITWSHLMQMKTPLNDQW